MPKANSRKSQNSIVATRCCCLLRQVWPRWQEQRAARAAVRTRLRPRHRRRVAARRGQPLQTRNTERCAAMSRMEF